MDLDEPFEIEDEFQNDMIEESLSSDDESAEDEVVDPGAEEFVSKLYGAGDFPDDDEPDIADTSADEDMV